MNAPARAVSAVAAALLFTAFFFAQGTSEGRLFWIGAFAILAAALGAAALPWPQLRGVPLAAVGLTLALVAWTGATIAWSIAADRSWAYLDRGLVYLAFLALGLFAAAAGVRARTIAYGLAVLLGAVLVWALLTKTIPALFDDGARVARLRDPIGYWNSLALTAAVAGPLGLWLASRGRELRTAGAALVYLAALVLLLTHSRAGIAVAALVGAAYIVRTSDRARALTTTALALVVAGAVGGWAFTRPGLTDDNQPYAARVDDGAWFGLLALAGLVLVAAVSWSLHGRPMPRRLAPALGVLLAAGAAAALGVALAHGGILGEREVSQGPGRFGEVSSSNRSTWWRESWQLFEREPAGGTGAGTFEVARRPIRDSALVTTEPHNLALQFLAETGIVGFLLFVTAVAAAAFAVGRNVHRLDGDERRAALALTLGVGAYLLHSLADLHFDFLAVSAPAFFVLGALLALGAPAARPGRALVTVPLVAAVAALYSLTAPWLSSRYVDDAYVRLSPADARTARTLNPLAIDPLFAIAETEAATGNRAEATRRYEEATRLQPENSSSWYALGAWEFALGNYRAALMYLDRAYGLDPWGPAGRPRGLLDQARAKVEGRECC